MSEGITGISLAIDCLPRPVGQRTDVSNFRQLMSRTLAEGTRSTAKPSTQKLMVECRLVTRHLFTCHWSQKFSSNHTLLSVEDPTIAK